MSLQAGIRRQGRAICWNWQSDIFGYAFDVYEAARSELAGSAHRLSAAAPYPRPSSASEDALSLRQLPPLHYFACNELSAEFEFSEEEIEAVYRALPKNSDEDPEDLLVRQAGYWHDPVAATRVVAVYEQFFASQPPDRKFRDCHREWEAAEIASDLKGLHSALRSDSAPFRIFVG